MDASTETNRGKAAVETDAPSGPTVTLRQTFGPCFGGTHAAAPGLWEAPASAPSARAATSTDPPRHRAADPFIPTRWSQMRGAHSIANWPGVAFAPHERLCRSCRGAAHPAPGTVVPGRLADVAGPAAAPRRDAHLASGARSAR